MSVLFLLHLKWLMEPLVDILWVSSEILVIGANSCCKHVDIATYDHLVRNVIYNDFMLRIIGYE